MPTLYVEPVKNDTECIFESCDDSQSEVDLEVDEDEGIYFFPGGEASCPVADFSRSWFGIDEMNSKERFKILKPSSDWLRAIRAPSGEHHFENFPKGWKMNIKINGIETSEPKLIHQAVLLR